MRDRREARGSTALRVVVDVDTAVHGLEVGEATLVGAVEGCRGLVDDFAAVDLRRIDSRHPTRGCTWSSILGRTTLSCLVGLHATFCATTGGNSLAYHIAMRCFGLYK